MKIAIVTDAWSPQVNGVVTTIGKMQEYLIKFGHEVLIINPSLFSTLPCPTYPEIRLAWKAKDRLKMMIDNFEPDAVHISTEGPLGWSARKLCIKRNYPFTTAFHTQFPEYIHARIGLPLYYSYSVLRSFHARADVVMCPTESVRKSLAEYGIVRTKIWSRGVDTELFHPQDFKHDLPRPILTYVGRVAVEKNLEEFLNMDFPGSKMVVGDGPLLPSLQKKYENVHFVGRKRGHSLARHYAGSDVFVFPSTTDTYGLVLLEALACGVPVAAFPVTGPKDIITSDKVGCLDWNLRAAVEGALKLKAEDCREFAIEKSWDKSATQFLNHLSPIKGRAADKTLFA